MGALPKFADPAAAGTWVPIGPAPILTLFTVTGVANGRVTAVAVSPADERIVLMGGDGGGIWRSEDGGATFQFAAETEGGVQAIEFSPIDPLLAYAVVNGNFSIGSSNTFYDGSFLRSTDGGRTWSKTPLPYTNASFPGVFYARVWPDPRERDRVLVTTFNAVWSSPDRGQTWSPALSCYFCDVAPFSSDPSVWLAFRSTPIGTTRAGMYRSADGGRTWTLEFTGPYAADEGEDGSLGVSRSSGTAYWCTKGRLYLTRDEGQTWSEQPKVYRSSLNAAPMPTICPMYIGVAGNDPDTLFFGFDQNEVFVSTDAGATFDYYYSNGKIPLHIDNRAFAVSTAWMYFGTDGGLYKGDAAARNVVALNEGVGSTVEFYSIAASPRDPAVVVGGTQDNGMLLGDTRPGAWRDRGGGDVGPIVFDANDPTRILWSVTVTGNAVNRSTGLTGSGFPPFTLVASVPKLEPGTTRKAYAWAGFGMPLARAQRGTVYTGTWHLYSSDNFGTTWTRTSELDLTRGEENGDMLTIIAIAVDDDSTLYTVSATNRVMRSSDGGATWTDVSPAALGTSFPDAKSFVALGRGTTALLGRKAFGVKETLLRTSDGGTTWTAVRNFPEVAVSALHSDRFEPGVVYAGTDAGVFRSTDAGLTWSFYGLGLPRCPVSALTRTADGRMIAATYGRGAYVFVPLRRRAARH